MTTYYSHKDDYTDGTPQHTQVDDAQVDDAEKAQKSKRRKNCCIGCCVCLVLLAILIALLVYFLYPRIPTTYVHQDQVVVKDWGYNETAIRMNVVVPVTIYNPNWVKLTLSFPSIEIYYARINQLMGRSTPIPRTEFPKMANTTVNFNIVLAQELNETQITQLANAIIAECGTNPFTMKDHNILLNMKALVKVAILRYDVNVPVDSNFNLPCQTDFPTQPSPAAILPALLRVRLRSPIRLMGALNINRIKTNTI